MLSSTSEAVPEIAGGGADSSGSGKVSKTGSTVISNGKTGEASFRPPSGFNDSRECSEAECDKEQRALDLEVQRVMESSGQKIDREELTSLLAR